jgi:hypothetical protein
MSTLQLCWRTVGRELANARRAEPLVRAVSWISAIAGFALAVWGASALSEQVSAWSLQGQLQLSRNLALTLAAICWGLGLWAAVGALRQGLANDEQQLLFTLPLRPAERWHALLARVVREWVGLSSPALALVAFGGGVVGALGWAGLPWLLVAVGGVTTTLTLGPLLAVAGAALLVRAPLPPGNGGGLAELGGRCYEALALRQRGVDRAPPAWVPPGLAPVLAAVERRRTAATALVWRGLLSQSRNWTFRLRLLTTPLLIAAGAWIAQNVTLPGVNEAELVAIIAITLGLLTIADGASSPVGGEGERIALLLLAPVPAVALLRGKLLALLLAVGLQALAATLSLGALLQLGALALLLVLAQVGVAMVGIAALIVGGSALDSDVSRSVEGALEALIVEEVPMTPVRLGLVGLGVVLAAAQCWLIVTLDGWAALAALALLSGGVGALALALGARTLRPPVAAPVAEGR